MRFILVVLILVFAGCGARQKVGVRATFKNHSIQRIAVMKVYATSTFSKDAAAFEDLRAMYVQATEEVVSGLGFETITTAEFESRFSTEAARQDFWDGVPTHLPLTQLFEPSRERVGREVGTVVALSDKLPARALLVAEIVYFTEAVCEEPATKHTRYSVVEPSQAPTPSPCVVSHYQAKLIDTESGGTMWHNRLLIEHRAPLNSETTKRVIFDNVRRVLDSENGLGNFRKNAS